MRIHHYQLLKLAGDIPRTIGTTEWHLDWIGSVVVDFLFIVTPIMEVCNCSMFCFTLLYVHSSIAIILMGKRELVALLNLSSWCLVMVERLFLAVPRGCLQFVIVVFCDHTLLLFFLYIWSCLNNMLWSTTSKALLKSIKNMPTISPLSMHSFHWSISLISAVWQLCFGRNPDWLSCINLYLFK